LSSSKSGRTVVIARSPARSEPTRAHWLSAGQSLSQSARTLFTIVQDGWASFPLQLSCPFTKQSRPSLFPYGPLGQTSYQQQQHLHSLQDKFATSSQAASSSRLTRQADPANESLLMQSILLCNLCLRCDGSVEDEAFLSLRASGSCN
jgi:hypothetical protein